MINLKNSNEISNREDKILVKRILKNESMAIKQFNVRFKKLIYSKIKNHFSFFGQTYSKDEMDEVFQNIMLRLFNSAFNTYLEQRYDDLPLTAFIALVSTNISKDYTKSRYGQYNQNIESQANEEGEVIEFWTSGESLDDEGIDREQKKMLLFEISQLKEINQQIVMMHLDGYENKEIAVKIGKAPGYIAKQIFNFKNFLQDKYKKVE